MGVEVLLHVVGPGELLGAPLERAWHGFLGRVDLGVARGVPRRGEGLFAAVRVLVAARVALGGFVARGHARDALGVVRAGAAVAPVVTGTRQVGRGDVGVLLVRSLPGVVAAVAEYGSRGGDGLAAHLGVERLGSEQPRGVGRRRGAAVVAIG